MDEGIFVIANVFILTMGIMGLLGNPRQKIWALFPFFGSMIAIYTAASVFQDGYITVAWFSSGSGLNVSPIPLNLIPLFFIFIDLIIAAWRAVS